MTALLPPHLCERDFLPPQEHQALLDYALASEARLAPAAMAGGRIDPQHRQALSSRDLGPLAGPLQRRIAEAAPRWTAALRATPFATSLIELELAAHNDGAHFRLHQDTYLSAEPARGDRMLSAVYYFHREPKRFEGGCLRLHRLGARAGDAGLDLAPEQNSVVVFLAWAPHEVLPVACPSRDFADSRFAVNAWVCRARTS